MELSGNASSENRTDPEVVGYPLAGRLKACSATSPLRPHPLSELEGRVNGGGATGLVVISGEKWFEVEVFVDSPGDDAGEVFL